VKKYFIVALLFMAEEAFSQVEATMPFMTTVAQSAYFNPAIKPRYNFSFALPSVFFQYASNGLTWDKTGTRDETSGKWTIDGDKLTSNLRKQNHFNLAAQANLFFLSLRVSPRFHLTVNADAKSYARLTLPQDAMAFFTQGNAKYIGQTLSLSPKAEMLTYFDLGIGGAYSVDRKLTLGARVKMLRGAHSLTTKKSQFDLTTQTGEISASADADFRTSGLHGKPFENLSFSKIWEQSGKNLGLGFDFGGTYQLNDRLTLGASVVDLGFISWTNKTYAYKLDPATSQVSFKGINIQDILNAPRKALDSIGSALKDKFKLKNEETGSYTTGIPTKVYLSGSYKLGHNITANGLLFFEAYSRFMPGLSASVQREFGKRMALNLSYTMTNNSYNNIGLGFSANVANMQLYLVGDNLVRGGIAILRKDLNSYINNTQFFTLRAGINVVLRWTKAEEKGAQPVEKKK